MYQGDYIPGAPIDDEARKRNGSLPGGGGVFNYVNFHVYHYGGNNPVKYVDPDGRAPGDAFDKPDEAAFDVLVFINNTSIDRNVEYSGAIYQNPDDGKYYATEPETLNLPDRSRSIPGPKGTKTVGQYHTHGNYMYSESGRIISIGEPGLDNHNSDFFHYNDIEGAAGRRVVAYLGTPSGIFRKYDPHTNRETVLGVAITHKQQYLSTLGYSSAKSLNLSLGFPSQVNHTLRNIILVSR